ncbi:MAG: hypothetical protein B1H06_03695 [Candidatus Cloacimonas sp. 4484_143]|nr:MAG: hypothetical protein B1H06_03695 [Candidatus Cloacimonas sp. 4484_143]
MKKDLGLTKLLSTLSVVAIILVSLVGVLEIVNAENTNSHGIEVIDGSAYVRMFLPKPENVSVLPDKGYTNPLKTQTAQQPPSKEVFWIENEVTGQWEKRNASLKKEGKYCYIYVDDNISVSDYALNISADIADKAIEYITKNLSAEFPDKDGYSKIFIFVLEIPTKPGYVTYGYFYWLDQTNGTHSNKKDLVYIDSRYIISNRETVAHELTHLSNYKYDHSIFGHPTEELWLAEGLAQYVQNAVFSKTTVDDITELRIDAFENYSEQSLIWNSYEPHMNAKYGVAFLYIWYLGEKYGESLIAKILTSSEKGIESIRQVLSVHQSFEDIFKNWVIANYLDGPTQNDDPSNPLWRYDSLDIQVSITNSISFTGQPDSTSDSVNQWAADYYKINIENPQADNFYYKLEYPLLQLAKDFWSALILVNDTGSTIIEKSILINQTTNFTQSKEYQRALKQAEEKGINVTKSILPETPPINANNSVTNAEKYQEIILTISPLDKSGNYTLKVEPISDKHKTTNSLSQGEKAVYVIPVNIFGQPNLWNAYESNGDVFVSVWWESSRNLDVKLTLASGKQGDVYYPDTGIEERKDVVGKSDLWPWENQVWKLELEEKGNPSDPSFRIATNYLEGSVDDNQMFSLPTKLEINPIQMFAGTASSPTQIEFEVEIYNGNNPFHYAPYNVPSASNFEVKVGGISSTILAVVQKSTNKYKLTVAPPVQQQDGKYNLSVNFTFEKFGVSNTASALLDDAVEYGAGEAVNVDIALVIDSSGSMSSNDPTDLRKAAAKYFVDFLSIGDWVAVVDFDSDVVVWKHLTNITNQAVKNEIKNAIDNIDSSGMTNIGGGLLYGYNELNSTQTGNRKAAILLTDGYHNTGTHPNQVVPKYKAKSWPIYTIALTGDADENLLKQIASETGGKYIKAEKAEDLLEIYNDLKKIVKKQSTLQKISKTISQGENITQDVMIDPSIRSFDVSVSWQGSDLDLYLYYPNGIQVELNASSPTGTNDPNITYISSSTYELYSVENPVPGRWSYEIIGKQIIGEENFTATVAATTEVILSATTDKLEYYLNEPVIIMATFTNLTGGIENADVTANITKPDGFVENVRLADKGSGSYSTVYTNTSLSGTYAVEVKANAGGVIRIASLQLEVLSTPPQVNVSPKEIDFGLSYPGDTKSAMFVIEYKSSGSVSALQSSAFTSLLKELESKEKTLIIQRLSSKIYLRAGQGGGLTGVVIVGDFVGENDTIEATNVMISNPVISLPTAGKLNITLQLNLPYDIKEGNYTSTAQVITNVGTDLINLNLTVQALSKSAVVNQIEDDLNDWLRAQTEGEKAYYIERIADRLVYWRFVGGGKR